MLCCVDNLCHDLNQYILSAWHLHRDGQLLVLPRWTGKRARKIPKNHASHVQPTGGDISLAG